MDDNNFALVILVFGVASIFGFVVLTAYLMKQPQPVVQAAKAPNPAPSETIAVRDKIGEKPLPKPTEEVRAELPHHINHHLNQANRWYEIKFERNLRNWMIRCRNHFNLDYAFVPSPITWFTLDSGTILSEDSSPQGIQAIYVRCSQPTIVELELWRQSREANDLF